MSRLYSARVILNALQRSGFIVVSQRGSHIKLIKRSQDKVYTAIVPNHKEVALGTFHSILKQSGLTKKEFEKLT